MVKHNFKATEGLLHDVMRKQAGTVEKAVLEAVMNSVDAGAETIGHQIGVDQLILEDDGKGMTRDEVRQYFEKFGLKDDDVHEKEFGKFRMGRGQIFNFGMNIWHSGDNLMVVDLNNDETKIPVEIVGDIDEDEYLNKTEEYYTLDSSGLGFNLLEAAKEYDGCKIIVQLYNELDSMTNTSAAIREQVQYIPWLHDVTYTINGDEIDDEFEFDDETPRAYYQIGSDDYGSSTKVYNQGAYVMEERLTNTKCVVVSKEDLDVNFARNDVLDTCEVFRTIKQELRQMVVEYLIETDEMKDNERRWLLEEAAGDDRVLDKIKAIPLIPDVMGEYHSINGLKNKKMTFAKKDHRLAEKVMKRKGTVVLDRNFKSAVKYLINESQTYSFRDVVDHDLGAEMKKYSDGDISKKRTKNLERLRWALQEAGFRIEVNAGYSSEMQMWIDDDETLVVHKNVLNWRKDRFITEGILMGFKYACHNGSTVQDFNDDWSYKNSLSDHIDSIAEAQYRLLSGNADIRA